MGQAQFVCGNNAGMTALGTLGVGDGLRMLKDALVNGGATQSVTSIVVAGAVATVTMASDPTWFKGQLITISGAAGGPTGFASMNKTTRILTRAAGVLTVDATGVSNGTVTGTLLAKVAALGQHAGTPWQEQFTGTNASVLRAQSGLRHVLQIADNANTNTMAVRAARSASAVATVTGPWPTVTQSSTLLKWPRPDPTAMTTLDWIVWGDEKRFLAGINAYSDANRVWCGFGELPLSFKSGDAYHSFIMGHANNAGDDTLNPSQTPNIANANYGGSQGAGAYYTPSLALARKYDQTTDSLICSALGGFGAGTYPYVSAYISTPPAVGVSSPISGGIELAYTEVLEFIAATSGYYRRARFLPLASWNQPDFASNDKTTYANIGDFGDIVIFRGDIANGGNGGIILPLGDLDSVYAQ
jgi:hypothetical protein